MKILLIISAMLLSVVAMAQQWQTVGGSVNPPIGSRFLYKANADSGLFSKGRPVLVDLDTMRFRKFLATNYMVDSIYNELASMGGGGGSSYLERKDLFNGGGSSFNLTQAPTSTQHFFPFLNNVLVHPNDYSLSGSTVTLGFTTGSSDRLTFYYSYGSGSTTYDQEMEAFTGITGNTIILSNAPTNNEHIIGVLNNVLIHPNDYSVSSTSVNLSFNVASTDHIVFYYSH